MKQANRVSDVIKKEPDNVLWSLYLIRLENGHLYTGISTDIKRRFSEHQTSKGAKYLRGKKNLKLIFNQTIGDRSTALKIEAKIKKLSKPDKEKLISGTIKLQKLLDL